MLNWFVGPLAQGLKAHTRKSANASPDHTARARQSRRLAKLEAENCAAERELQDTAHKESDDSEDYHVEQGNIAAGDGSSEAESDSGQMHNNDHIEHSGSANEREHRDPPGRGQSWWQRGSLRWSSTSERFKHPRKSKSRVAEDSSSGKREGEAKLYHIPFGTLPPLGSDGTDNERRRRRLLGGPDTSKDALDSPTDPHVLYRHAFVPHTWLFRPYSWFTVRWTILVLVITLLAAILVPVNIAWFEGPHTDPRAYAFFETFNIMITVIFVLDMIVIFNTSCLAVHTRKLITNRGVIAMRYLKVWFWLDLAAALPWDAVAPIGELVLLRLLKLLRMARLFKLLGSRTVLRAVEAENALRYDVISLVKFGLFSLLLMHLMSCGLFIIPTIAAKGHQSFIDLNEIGDLRIWAQWLYGYFWAAQTCSTIGYGNVDFANNVERGFGIIAMIVGASMYAYMVGALIGVLQSMNASEHQRRDTLREVNELMHFVKLPRPQQTKIRRFLSKTHAGGSKTMKDYHVYFKKLSPPLAAEVFRHIHREWMPHVWWLNTNEDGFTVGVGMLLLEQSFAPREVIFRATDAANLMYVVRRGAVFITGMGTYFGKQAFGQEIILGRLTAYGYSAFTKGYVDLWRMERGGFIDLLQEYPLQRRKAKMAEMVLYIKRNGGSKRVLQIAQDLYGPDEVKARMGKLRDKRPQKDKKGTGSHTPRPNETRAPTHVVPSSSESKGSSQGSPKGSPQGSPEDRPSSTSETSAGEPPPEII